MENSSFPDNNTVTNNISLENEEIERNFLGNHWPRQETLALLKIRSEMDVSFRDSGVKAPLWEDVSRFAYFSLFFSSELSLMFLPEKIN